MLRRVSTMSAAARGRLRSIMHSAWSVFRGGRVVSFSMALRIAWRLDKGQVSPWNFQNYLRKKR